MAGRPLFAGVDPCLFSLLSLILTEHAAWGLNYTMRTDHHRMQAFLGTDECGSPFPYLIFFFGPDGGICETGRELAAANSFFW